jgi:hypothetical protein
VTDLTFDPDELDDDLVTRCSLAAGPRAGDPEFDPRPGDQVRVDDGADMPLRAVVIARDADTVTVRILERHPLEVAVVRLALCVSRRPHRAPCVHRRRPPGSPAQHQAG